MSELVGLIDAWKDSHGQPSDSSIARAIGASRQTISSWRTRGIRELPDQEALERLAIFLGLSYDQVILPAVLRDVGYLPKETSDEHQGPTVPEAGSEAG